MLLVRNVRRLHQHVNRVWNRLFQNDSVKFIQGRHTVVSDLNLRFFHQRIKDYVYADCNRQHVNLPLFCVLSDEYKPEEYVQSDPKPNYRIKER